MNKKINILIPTYNRPDRLRRCLTSLSKQTYPKNNYEVVIVDDGSPQNLKSVIEEFNREMDIVYIKKERGGPASARNTGLKHVKGEIVAFTDDDCVIDKNWLYEIEDAFKDNSEAMCVKGRTLALEPNDFSKACEMYIYGSKKSHATNNIAYKRTVFDKIGSFDTRYVHAYEDVDLKWRFLKQGFKRVYAESMIVYHPHEDSISVFKKNAYISGTGLGIFFKKYLLKRPILSFGSLLFDMRYLPLSWYYLLIKQKEYSSTSLRSIRSALVLKGFLHALTKKLAKQEKDYRK